MPPFIPHPAPLPLGEGIENLAGWVRRRYRYHPLPEELSVRLTPHPAQATGRLFQVSDGTPVDRCSRVTFTLTGIQLFPWMSPLLLVHATSHPATSAPFQVGHRPIRRVMSSPCLSAAGLRFLAVLSPNMAKTSFTSVGSSADSPEPLLRPWPATGHDAEKLEV
jgi:hypothetical protein